MVRRGCWSRGGMEREGGGGCDKLPSTHPVECTNTYMLHHHNKSPNIPPPLLSFIALPCTTTDRVRLPLIRLSSSLCESMLPPPSSFLHRRTTRAGERVRTHAWQRASPPPQIPCLAVFRTLSISPHTTHHLL